MQKTITKETYQRMRRWIYRYAFHIDLTLFQFHIENGTKEEVVKALSFYQNEDGGFVSFDPDCWNPNSSPLATLSAYDTLKEIGITDKNHEMVKAMINYMSQCEYCTEQGCYWSIPSNNKYPSQAYFLFPHAPWHPEDWPAEGYVNGKYVDFVLTYYTEDSPMYQKIRKVIDYRISNLQKYQEFCSFTCDMEQEIETNDWLNLFEALEKHQIMSRDECDILQNQLLAMTKEYAQPSVYESMIRQLKEKESISTYGYLTDDILDEMIDSICINRDWSEDGLLCNNPEERVKELTCIGNIMWPIVELINKLAKLKRHHRIEG